MYLVRKESCNLRSETNLSKRLSFKIIAVLHLISLQMKHIKYNNSIYITMKRKSGVKHNKQIKRKKINYPFYTPINNTYLHVRCFLTANTLIM